MDYIGGDFFLGPIVCSIKRASEHQGIRASGHQGIRASGHPGTCCADAESLINHATKQGRSKKGLALL